MIKENVIRLRDVVHKDATYITVIGDNAQEFDSQARFLVWDDEKEELHAIYANDNATQQIKNPMMMLSTTYENIQYIYGYYTHESFKKLTKDLKDTGKIDEAYHQRINTYSNGVNNFDVDIKPYYY